jgi:hypothetical protein
LLPFLAEQKIDVVIIDNESTDQSRELYSAHMGNPILALESLPYRGFLSLSEQLSAKQKLCKTVNHDWVIHQDADEILEHCCPGRTLRDAIQEADTAGYNALNFEEFVFLPEPGSDYCSRNYYTDLLRYYFFAPHKNRLNRAWKRSSGLTNTGGGGHNLQGDNLLISPANHILRHYIVLSEKHARTKYLQRSFDPQCLAKGWHRNRLKFNKNNLLMPKKSNFLFYLNKYDSKAFYRTRPTDRHFWEWKKQKTPKTLKKLAGFFKTR